jgi:hypothetical protein
MTDTATICWHDTRGSRCPRPRDGEVIGYGRCRSGRRWFWAATVFSYTTGNHSVHGWADSEPDALAAARDTVVRLADGRPARAYLKHGIASGILKAINAHKRAERPTKGGDTTAPVEYLYAIDVGYRDDNNTWVPDRVARFPITKKTARRIYYVRRTNLDGDIETGYVNRQQIEDQGQVFVPQLGWPHVPLLSIRAPELPQYRQDAPDLTELKARMCDAHPDRGGTNEEFRAARARYEAVRRMETAR